MSNIYYTKKSKPCAKMHKALVIMPNFVWLNDGRRITRKKKTFGFLRSIGEPFAEFKPIQQKPRPLGNVGIVFSKA